MDQHLHDRDIDDLIEAVHKGSYLGTRFRNTEPLVSMTDASTFDFHANSTKRDQKKVKFRNGKPKNLLAASVRGGVFCSIHRSVTGTLQMLSNTQRFNAIG